MLLMVLSVRWPKVSMLVNLPAFTSLHSLLHRLIISALSLIPVAISRVLNCLLLNSPCPPGGLSIQPVGVVKAEERSVP